MTMIYPTKEKVRPLISISSELYWLPVRRTFLRLDRSTLSSASSLDGYFDLIEFKLSDPTRDKDESLSCSRHNDNKAHTSLKPCLGG